VAGQVDLAIPMGASLLPPFEVPDGLTADQYLQKKVEDGLRWRFGDSPSQAAR
jgi:hypothetical protein